MSHLFIPTALEVHLLVEHGVDSRLMVQVHRDFTAVADDVGEMSHKLMHSCARFDHAHEEHE